MKSINHNLSDIFHMQEEFFFPDYKHFSIIPFSFEFERYLNN